MSQVEEVNIKTCFDVAVTVNVTYGAENYELLLERLNKYGVKHIVEIPELVQIINPSVVTDGMPQTFSGSALIILDHADWNKTSLIDLFNDVCDRMKNYAFGVRANDDSSSKEFKTAKKFEKFLEGETKVFYIDNPYLREYIMKGPRADFRKFSEGAFTEETDNELAPAVIFIKNHEVLMNAESKLSPFSKGNMAEIVSFAVGNSISNPKREIIDILENYEAKNYGDRESDQIAE